MSFAMRPTFVAVALVALLAGASPASAAPGGGKGAGGPCKRCAASSEPAADTTAPALNIGAPEAAGTVSGTTVVTGTASDDGSGVVAVDIRVDGGVWQRASGTSSWAWSWPTTAADNGTRTLTARAMDGAGNARTVSRTVTVWNPVADTTAPTVGFSAPVAGATVSGTTTVAGTAHDDREVARVEVRIDSGPWMLAAGTTAWSWSWPTTPVADGPRTIAVRATDASGNATVSSRAVTVANSASSPAPSQAPDTQGTWTSPEGTVVDVQTTGPWTIRSVYELLRRNARNLDEVGRTLTVRVRDTGGCQNQTSASTSGGVFTSVTNVLSLQGVNSTFTATPDAVMAHEYGHSWAEYYGFLARQDDWTPYLEVRGLLGDERLDSSYSWSPGEIIADDYRLLFGSAEAVRQRPRHLNGWIADPRDVQGLGTFLLEAWTRP